MGSAIHDLLSQGHIVYGTLNAGLDTLTCNDGSATVTDDGTGLCTVTFGEAFLSTPVVVAQPVGTIAATVGVQSVSVVASATDSVQFSIGISGDTDTVPSVADAVFGFLAVGLRNN